MLANKLAAQASSAEGEARRLAVYQSGPKSALIIRVGLVDPITGANVYCDEACVTVSRCEEACIAGVIIHRALGVWRAAVTDAAVLVALVELHTILQLRCWCLWYDSVCARRSTCGVAHMPTGCTTSRTSAAVSEAWRTLAVLSRATAARTLLARGQQMLLTSLATQVCVCVCVCVLVLPSCCSCVCVFRHVPC